MTSAQDHCWMDGIWLSGPHAELKFIEDHCWTEAWCAGAFSPFHTAGILKGTSVFLI